MNTRKTTSVPEIAGSEITPLEVYQQRRQLLALAGAALGGLALAPWNSAAAQQRLIAKPNPGYQAGDPPTAYADATSFNNFYEFGTDKSDPARHAGSLKTRPWTLVVDGEVLKPRTFSIDDLLKLAPLEERLYRLRCVEGWSMVIPWIGFPLSRLLQQVQPNGQARYIETTTLLDPSQMPGQHDPVLQWPYVEGLRLDEAMHPLALLTFGMYGQVLPNQNGAPLRMVVPWKYGFKGGKSLVRIRLVREQPVTSWMRAVPDWYGFYSNVNPEVSPQNWSQSSERVIGRSAFAGHRPTQLFNGYAAQVADLYRGMDLRRYF